MTISLYELADDCGSYSGHIAVQASPLLLPRIKALPGSRYFKRGTVWAMPKHWTSALMLSSLAKETKEKLVSTPALGVWVREQKQEWAELAEKAERMLGTAHDGWFPHQDADVEWLTYEGGPRGRLLLNEMGVGKTASVLFSALKSNTLPALIVCPKTVARSGWLVELAKRAPHLRVGVALGSAAERVKVFAAAERGELDVVLTGYEVMKLHTRFAHFGGAEPLKRCPACGGPKLAQDAGKDKYVVKLPAAFVERWESGELDIETDSLADIYQFGYLINSKRLKSGMATITLDARLYEFAMGYVGGGNYGLEDALVLAAGALQDKLRAAAEAACQAHEKEINRVPWRLVVMDECFVPEALVDTPSGPRAIGELWVGDEIYGYDESKSTVVVTTVTATMERTAPVVGNFVTGNHPIRLADGNYVPVSDLRSDDEVVLLDSMHVVRRGVLAEAGYPWTEVLQSKLFDQTSLGRSGVQEENDGLAGQAAIGSYLRTLQRGVHPETSGNSKVERSAVLWTGLRETLGGKQSGDTEQDGQESWQSGEQGALTHSYDCAAVAPGCSSEAGSSSSGAGQSVSRSGDSGSLPRGASKARLGHAYWWQRARLNSATTGTAGSARTGVAAGARSADQEFIYSGSGVSAVSLQDRRSLSIADDRNRSGRRRAQVQEGSGSGPAQGNGIVSTRMDGSEILEPRNPEQLAAVSGEDRRVLNIETGTSNYFVDGVLVHNCHRLLNASSQTKQAASGILRSAPNARRWALTGTPVSKRPDGPWSLLNFVDPEGWPVKSDWVERFCTQGYNVQGFWEVTGYRPERMEEFQRTWAAISRRVTKDIALDLPPLLRGGSLVREVVMGAEQAAAYKQMRDEMVLQVREGTLVASNFAIQMQRLVALAGATGYPGRPGQMLLRAPSCKLEEVAAGIRAGEFGTQYALAFKSARLLRMFVAGLQEKDLLGAGEIGIVDGAAKDEDRAADIAAFQEGELTALFFTYGAGGAGVTLTAAETLVLVEREWSPVLMEQGLGRVHRAGMPQRPVAVVDIITADSVEYRQLERLAEDADLLEEVVRDKERMERFLMGDKG